MLAALVHALNVARACALWSQGLRFNTLCRPLAQGLALRWGRARQTLQRRVSRQYLQRRPLERERRRPLLDRPGGNQSPGWCRRSPAFRSVAASTSCSAVLAILCWNMPACATQQDDARLAARLCSPITDCQRAAMSPFRRPPSTSVGPSAAEQHSACQLTSEPACADADVPPDSSDA